MANLRDPSVVLGDTVAVVKLWHAFYGIFLWEFFTTLDFEWSVIRGHRGYRWTIWIYSLARLATLVAIILDIVGFSVSGPINCQVLVILEFTFSYFAVACASLLIVLRVYAESHAGNAIWSRNKIVLALGACLWGTNIAFLIQGTVRLHSVWEPEESLSVCVVPNSDVTKLNVIITFVTNLVLLLMMVIGLLRIHVRDGGMLNLGLWSFLWRESIICLSLSVVAWLPPVVFLTLNINEEFNLMFQVPALIAFIIAATRFYRPSRSMSLSSVTSGYPNSGISSGLSFAKVKGVPDPDGMIANNRAGWAGP